MYIQRGTKNIVLKRLMFFHNCTMVPWLYRSPLSLARSSFCAQNPGILGDAMRHEQKGAASRAAKTWDGQRKVLHRRCSVTIPLASPIRGATAKRHLGPGRAGDVADACLPGRLATRSPQKATQSVGWWVEWGPRRAILLQPYVRRVHRGRAAGRSGTTPGRTGAGITGPTLPSPSDLYP